MSQLCTTKSSFPSSFPFPHPRDHQMDLNPVPNAQVQKRKYPNTQISKYINTKTQFTITNPLDHQVDLSASCKSPLVWEIALEFLITLVQGSLQAFAKKRPVSFSTMIVEVVVQHFLSCYSRRNKAIWVEKSDVISARTVLWLSWGGEGSKTKGFIISRKYPRLHLTLSSI